MGIQIHDLELLTSPISQDTVLAIDDGTETFKVPATELGVRTEMTLEEANEGLSTEPRVITAKVLHDFTGIDMETIALYESLGWEP